MHSPRDILVVKPSSLGDIVHTLPSVAFLKRHWPAARLHWLINSEWAPLLGENPCIDESVIFPRRDFRGVLGWVRFAPWARSLRKRINADLVLDFQGLLRSALISRLCRGAGGRVVGLSDAREGARFFYDAAAEVRDQVHAVDRYRALVASLGIPVDGPLSWPLPEGRAADGFSITEPFVLLHPFARGAGKSLSLPDVAAFCRAIAPVRVVLAGRAAAGAVPNDANLTVLVNRTTIRELIWLIRRAVMVVSVDSGPMHIAAAIAARLVAIHTWSDPRKVGPYRDDAWIWQAGQLYTRRDREHPERHLAVPNCTALAIWAREELERGAAAQSSA